MCKNSLKQGLISFLVTLITLIPVLGELPSNRSYAYEHNELTARTTQDTTSKPGQQDSAGKQDRNQRRIDADRLARAESRLAALRDQLANLQMRESELQSRIDELNYQMKPESLQRALAFVGSVRPMDELRGNLRARLDKEKSRTSAQLDALVATRMKVEAAIRDAEAECARLRERLDVGS